MNCHFYWYILHFTTYKQFYSALFLKYFFCILCCFRIFHMFWVFCENLTSLFFWVKIKLRSLFDQTKELRCCHLLTCCAPRCCRCSSSFWRSSGSWCRSTRTSRAAPTRSTPWTRSPRTAAPTRPAPSTSSKTATRWSTWSCSRASSSTCSTSSGSPLSSSSEWHSCVGRGSVRFTHKLCTHFKCDKLSRNRALSQQIS